MLILKASVAVFIKQVLFWSPVKGLNSLNHEVVGQNCIEILSRPVLEKNLRKNKLKLNKHIAVISVASWKIHVSLSHQAIVSNKRLNCFPLAWSSRTLSPTFPAFQRKRSNRSSMFVVMITGNFPTFRSASWTREGACCMFARNLSSRSNRVSAPFC